MNAIATVQGITQTRKHDAGQTPVDIVKLSYDGKLYVWEAAPGAYAVGQEISVRPPASQGANITPAG